MLNERYQAQVGDLTVTVWPTEAGTDGEHVAWGYTLEAADASHGTSWEYECPVIYSDPGAALAAGVVDANERQVEVEGPPRYFVNVYELDQGYGGPEEGGWWFSIGTPVDLTHLIGPLVPENGYDAEAGTFVFDSLADAEAMRETLRRSFPSTGKQYSVIGGEDYSVIIENTPPQAWPTERPHYE